MKNLENRLRKSKRTEKEKEPKKRTSIWKWLFLLLLALNLAFAAFAGVRVIMPRDTAVFEQTQNTKDEKVAEITSTTSQLNTLINAYLSNYQTKTLSYKFYISDQQAVLEASYQFMGTKIPLYVYFEPLALANGSISLSVKSISAGTLSLPPSTVLQMLKSYHIPSFVEIKSKQSQVILHLDQFVLAHQFYFKTNQIDLVNGTFAFDLMKKA